MHSSGMRTARLLTVSQHALWWAGGGGCTCPGGGLVYLPGECTCPGGVPALGGVPAQAGVPAQVLPHLWTDRHVSWFMSAHRFPYPGCLATVIKPAWGLVTSAKPLHLSHNTLQMVAPRVAIWSPPSNGVGACTAAMHVHPTQNFYKRDARRISGLTFS